MDVRRAIVFCSLALLIASLLPIASSDAMVEREDVSVNIPGYQVDTSTDDLNIDVEVSNGKSTEVVITLLNKSGGNLGITAEGTESGDVTVTGTVDKPYLEGKGSMTPIRMTVSADSYAENTVQKGTLFIRVYDLSVDHFEPITITVTADVSIASTFYSDDQYNKFFGLVPNTLPKPLNSPWVSAAVSVLCWVAITMVVTALLVPLLVRTAGFRKGDAEKQKLSKSLRKSLCALIFVVAINHSMQILGAGPEISHSVDLVSNVLYVALLSLIVWQIYVYIMSAFFTGMDAAEVKGLDKSLIPLFRMLGKIIICVSAMAAILASFGVDLGGILVSAGVVTLGITLGAQNTLNQFFSGIVLLAARPFQAGDFVMINDVTYIVRKVKLMFTEFYNWDKDRVITMPNNVVSSATLVNITGDGKVTKVFIYMSVDYTSDLDLVKKLLIAAAESHPHVVSNETFSGPSTRLTNFLDSGIEYRLGFYVDDFDSSGTYAGEIKERIFKLFNENGISIPYNRVEVSILDPSEGRSDRSRLRIPQNRGF